MYTRLRALLREAKQVGKRRFDDFSQDEYATDETACFKQPSPVKVAFSDCNQQNCKGFTNCRHANNSNAIILQVKSESDLPQASTSEHHPKRDH